MPDRWAADRAAFIEMLDQARSEFAAAVAEADALAAKSRNIQAALERIYVSPYLAEGRGRPHVPGDENRAVGAEE